MNPEDQEEMSEKTLASDETITIATTKGGYDVDCWDANGNNRWHKFFTDYNKAKAEYNRWN